MIGGKSLQFGDRIWFFLGGYHRADSPIAGRVGKKHFSCPSLWGFHPHAPGYFLLVQKVTKNTRGGEGFRFPSPPHYSPQEPRFTRGIAAATYAKNMPQAYFLNAAALARGATPPADLGAGCTTRTWVMVQIRHCDDHTAVCSRLGQFDSRPRGEWFFVAVLYGRGADCLCYNYIT